jgi:hypothetical protein
VALPIDVIEPASGRRHQVVHLREQDVSQHCCECPSSQPRGSLCAGQQWGRQVWMGL